MPDQNAPGWPCARCHPLGAHIGPGGYAPRHFGRKKLVTDLHQRHAIHDLPRRLHHGHPSRPHHDRKSAGCQPSMLLIFTPGSVACRLRNLGQLGIERLAADDSRGDRALQFLGGSGVTWSCSRSRQSAMAPVRRPSRCGAMHAVETLLEQENQDVTRLPNRLARTTKAAPCAKTWRRLRYNGRSFGQSAAARPIRGRLSRILWRMNPLPLLNRIQ